MMTDQGQAFLLLGTSFARRPLEEAEIDSTIEFVDIHHVDARLQTIVFGLYPTDRIFMVSLFIVVTQLQGHGYPRKHLVVEPELIKQLGEPRIEQYPRGYKVQDNCPWPDHL